MNEQQWSSTACGTRTTEERLLRENRTLTVLHETAAALMQNLDASDLLQKIVDRATDLLSCSYGFIGLVSRSGRDLEIRYTTGGSQPTVGMRIGFGEGIAGRVWASQTPLVVDDLRTWSGGTVSGLESYRGVAEVPLIADDRVLGILGVAVAHDREPFASSDLDTLARFAGIASIALRNAELFEKERTARVHAETVLEATKAVTSSLDLPRVLRTILQQLQRVVPCDSASVQELRADRAVIVASIGLDLDRVATQSFDLMDDTIPNGRVVRRREPLIINDVAPLPAFRDEPVGAGIRAWMGVPLVYGEKVVGLITLDKKQPDFYTDEHARVASVFAAQAAIAIRNARLYAAAGEELARRIAIEEQLRAAQEEYRALVEQLPATIIYRYSIAERRTLYISPQVEALLGYPQTAWLGNADLWRTVIHPDDRPIAGDALKRNRDHGTEINTTHRLIARDGRVLWFQHHSRTLRDGDTAVELHGVMLDVTKLKDAEQEVGTARRDAEARAEQLAALNRIAVAVTNVAKIDSVLNAVAQGMTEILDARSCAITLIDESRSELRVVAEHSLNRTAAGLVFPLDDRNASSLQVVRSGRPLIVPDAQTSPLTESLHESLRERETHGLVIAPLVVRGEVIGTIGVDTDRVDRVFTETDVRLLETIAGQVASAIDNARLFAEESRSRALAERLEASARVLNESLDPEVVLPAILDELRRVIEYDSASIQLVENDSMRVIAVRGLPESEIGHVRPLGSFAYNRRLATDPEPFIFDVETNDTTWPGHADYLKSVRSNIGIPLVIRDRIIGALTVDSRQKKFYDERHLRIATAFARQAAIAIENARLYAELLRSKDAADAANKAKSAFLATMSHELRTPLNAIIGFSGVLESTVNDKLTERQQRFLRNIRTSGEYLLGIINDILDLSKIEAGKMTFEPEAVSMPEMIESICRILRGVALPRGIQLVTEVARDVTVVEADPIKLKQILYNLVANAVKFSPDTAAVTIAARSVGDAIEVSVTDEGIGIDPRDHEMIFEEFTQVERTKSGTGLGLTLVKRYLEMHGGSIRVQSAPGSGSRFVFVIPQRLQAERSAS